MKTLIGEMSLIQITDNCDWTPISNLSSEEMIDSHIKNLQKIANVNIREIALEENPNLLVFPRDWRLCGDQISENRIISLHDKQLSTGNIMGFIGINETQLKINSRFASNDENDYFLHYMLQKVFSINLFDLKHAKDNESIFDFLLYLFPHFLKKALTQGLFKKYQTFHCNDANVKGVVNVSRHIRDNMPFKGSVSYAMRAHSYDNEITQLVRHTIEHIRSKEHGSFILTNDRETKECVAQIVQATPSFNLRERIQIIHKNLRPLHHPFYSNYTALQRLCLQILRHENLKFGREKDKVYGVLFDGAWLWEEYLATILKDVDRMVHPKNRKRKDGIQIYKGGQSFFPDFYRKGVADEGIDSFVLDAKYKRLSRGLNSGELEENVKSGFSIQREDLFQMISYMHTLPAQTAALLYPFKDADNMEIKVDKKVLLGLGGDIFGMGVPIPQESDFIAFSKFMNGVENELKRVVNRLIE